MRLCSLEMTEIFTYDISPIWLPQQELKNGTRRHAGVEGRHRRVSSVVKELQTCNADSRRASLTRDEPLFGYPVPNVQP